jgi:acyl-CoA thioesterase
VGDFARDTSVRREGEGSYSATIDESWWVVAGPNGGYVAAILVRALTAAEPRPLRSLTVHYLRPPQAGEARVHVTTERTGRSVSYLSARLEQDARPCALALAVLATDRDGALELDDAPAPDVAQPDAIEPQPDHPDAPPFGRHFDFRPALGARPFSGASEALTGGWLRLREDPQRPLDASLVTALTDSWYPAAFAVATRPLAVPTLDLTVHIRAALPQPAGWVLSRVRTRVARAGMLEEDAELWSAGGELLAQSRQLALAL